MSLSVDYVVIRKLCRYPSITSLSVGIRWQLFNMCLFIADSTLGFGCPKAFEGCQSVGKFHSPIWRLIWDVLKWCNGKVKHVKDFALVFNNVIIVDGAKNCLKLCVTSFMEAPLPDLSSVLTCNGVFHLWLFFGHF